MIDREQNLLELAWGIIANVSGGDWDKQTDEWKAAATRWRDKWNAAPTTGTSVLNKGN